MLERAEMCQATVYLVQDGREEELMRDVVLLEPDREGLRLQAFFEEPVVVKARVSRIDFLKHTVTLTPLAEG
jgi:predicted RNA-binding protein